MQRLQGRTYAYKVNGHGHRIIAGGALHLGQSVVIRDALAELAGTWPRGEREPLGEHAGELLHGAELRVAQFVAAEYRAVGLERQRRAVAQRALGQLHLATQLHVAL